MNKRTLILLDALKEDARATSKSIAKKLRVSQQAANHKIHKLKEDGVIRKYTTIFDGARLGLGLYWALMRFKKFDAPKIKAFLGELVRNTEVVRIEKLNYKWDLLAVFSCPNTSKFNINLKRIYESNSGLLEDFEVMPGVVSYLFDHSLYKKRRRIRDYQVLYGNRNIAEISGIDKGVAKYLMKDARMSALRIAKELKCSPQTVLESMRRLKKNKIIHGYTTHIEPKKIGVNMYLVFMNLKFFHSNYPHLLTFCKSHPLVVEMHRLFGSWQTMIEIMSPDMDSCLELVKQIQRLNAPFVNRIELVSSDKCLKYEFLPESLFE
jgi:DNA-binding Lrp family transcriptional regulator